MSRKPGAIQIGVFLLSDYVHKSISEKLNLDEKESMEMLLNMRDAVKIPSRKKTFIRSHPEELDR